MTILCQPTRPVCKKTTVRFGKHNCTSNRPDPEPDTTNPKPVVGIIFFAPEALQSFARSTGRRRQTNEGGSAIWNTPCQKQVSHATNPLHNSETISDIPTLRLAMRSSEGVPPMEKAFFRQGVHVYACAYLVRATFGDWAGGVWGVEREGSICQTFMYERCSSLAFASSKNGAESC